MDKRKGFTLVELVIVIVIVGVLSIVAVPIYRGYTRKAMVTEGKSLLGSILNAEKIYFAEHSNYKEIPNASPTNFDMELDVDARSNKYFTDFVVDVSGDTFTAQSAGYGGASGIVLTVIAGKTIEPTWVDNGLND